MPTPPSALPLGFGCLDLLASEPMAIFGSMRPRLTATVKVMAVTPSAIVTLTSHRYCPVEPDRRGRPASSRKHSSVIFSCALERILHVF